MSAFSEFCANYFRTYFELHPTEAIYYGIEGRQARDGIALQRITEEIDRLERTPVRTRVYTRYSELYRWPLGIALLALALELSLAAWRGPLP